MIVSGSCVYDTFKFSSSVVILIYILKKMVVKLCFFQLKCDFCGYFIFWQQIDARALRAVAIEHSKDADAAVEAVLLEIIPFFSERSRPSTPSTGNTTVGQPLGGIKLSTLSDYDTQTVFGRCY